VHTAKLILNATMVGVLNLAAFVIGFLIFSISASGEQLLVQGTAALIVGIALVVGWLVLFRKFNRFGGDSAAHGKGPPGGLAVRNWLK